MKLRQRMIFAYVVPIILLLLIPVNVHAKSTMDVIILDNANLMTEQEESECKEYIKNNAPSKVETFILYSSNEPVPDANTDAEKIYRENTDNKNGVILYINMNTQKFAYWASGFPYRSVNNNEIDDILDAGIVYLSTQNYKDTYQAMAQTAFQSMQNNSGRNQNMIKISLILLPFSIALGFITYALQLRYFHKKYKVKDIQNKQYELKFNEELNQDVFVKEIENIDVDYYKPTESSSSSSGGGNGTSFSGSGSSGGGSRSF